MQPGDVIRKFDGREVRTLRGAAQSVSQAELEKKVELEIVRNGKPMTGGDGDQGAAGRLPDGARDAAPAAAGTRPVNAAAESAKRRRIRSKR